MPELHDSRVPPAAAGAALLWLLPGVSAKFATGGMAHQEMHAVLLFGGRLTGGQGEVRREQRAAAGHILAQTQVGSHVVPAGVCQQQRLNAWEGELCFL